MRKRKPVEHQLTLLAFTRCENGRFCIYDIVETSRYFAPKFARRWRRDPEVCGIAAASPGTLWAEFGEPRQ